MSLQAAIPASEFVNAIPSVLTPGGAGVVCNGVLIDNSGDTSIPIGSVQAFASATAVGNWYGFNSAQYAFAEVYFGGFINADQLPSLLYIAQYNAAAVAAYVRSGTLGLTLAQLQAFSGTLTTIVNGTSYTSSSINLASASSFTNAAALIQAGIQTGGNTATCTYDSLRGAFVITSPTTGAGSTMGVVGGTLAASINFTAANGAVLSQGANATTAAVTMAAVTAAQQDWVTFTTLTEPILSIKEAFAIWVNGQNQQFAYVCADSNATPANGNDNTCFAQVTANYNGVIPCWYSTSINAQPLIAAFVMGALASIDFEETDGRITLAFKGQTGLVPDVTSLSAFVNLKANGYNMYCNVANAAQQWQFFQPGQISGTWEWIDDYIDQVYWNSQFQAALMSLLTTIKAIPYNPTGYNLIRQTLMPVIAAMGSFGAWVSGVSLSGSQAAAVNAAAGLIIAPTLSSQGFYLQILDPGPTVRGQRGTPIIKFWYTDGGSVQTITISSIDVE